MLSEFVVTIIGSLLALFLVVLYFAEPADDALAAEVILGDRRDDNRWLPPVFVDFAGAKDLPQNTLAAIQDAKRMNASGIKLYMFITSDDVGVLFHVKTLEVTTNGDGPLDEVAFEDLRREDITEKNPSAVRYRNERVPTLEEGVDECLRQGLRIIVNVEGDDFRAMFALAELFRKRPELSRRVLVVSPSPMFLFRLGGHNATFVTALAWRHGTMAYVDKSYTKRRYENIGWHLIARAADWLLSWSFDYGLLTRLSMVSAVLVNASMISPQYAQSWSDWGLRVIALASNDPAEHEYLRRVVQVPILTDNLRRT